MQESKSIEVLLELFNKHKPGFPRDLLVRCYEIEEKYQFDQNRDRSIRELEDLVDKYIAGISESDSGE